MIQIDVKVLLQCSLIPFLWSVVWARGIKKDGVCGTWTSGDNSISLFFSTQIGIFIEVFSQIEPIDFIQQSQINQIRPMNLNLDALKMHRGWWRQRRATSAIYEMTRSILVLRYRHSNMISEIQAEQTRRFCKLNSCICIWEQVHFVHSIEVDIFRQWPYQSAEKSDRTTENNNQPRYRRVTWEKWFLLHFRSFYERFLCVHWYSWRLPPIVSSWRHAALNNFYVARARFPRGWN